MIQQKPIGIFISFMLVFAVFMQSMVMAKAIGTLPMPTMQDGFKIDAYGSQICGDAKGELNHKNTIPECCLTGCILNIAARNYFPPENFLTIKMRPSEALFVKPSLMLSHLIYPFNHHARAPPHA